MSKTAKVDVQAAVAAWKAAASKTVKIDVQAAAAAAWEAEAAAVLWVAVGLVACSYHPQTLVH